MKHNIEYESYALAFSTLPILTMTFTLRSISNEPLRFKGLIWISWNTFWMATSVKLTLLETDFHRLPDFTWG